MRAIFKFLLAGLSILPRVIAEKVPIKDHQNRQYFAIGSSYEPDELLALHNDWRFEHAVRGLEKHYVFSRTLEGFARRDDMSDREGVDFYEDLRAGKYLHKRAPIDSAMLPIKEAEERLGIDDPLFERQWHLINPLFPGNDVNVKDLWYDNITGKGVVAAIIDDGVDYESEDLRDNFCEEGSWDFNDNQKLPKPKLVDDHHGTRCAGEIAAVKNNHYCGIGVAYGSKVSGIRILSGELTAEDEAASLVYGLDINDIYSCSWGPSDDGRHLQGPSELVKKSLVKGILDGRNKKGALYVFASGNGGSYGDNCNYDGYTNSIYSITVGAIDHKGLHPPYAESCAAVMVVTYSSGSGEFIHSTDINDRCNDRHGGTSAAAPLAAGIYALLFEVNPDLTWRDVQYLSVLSSDEIKNSDANSQLGALGKNYSHRYGYGKLNAAKLIEMAKDWKNVNPQSWYYHPTQLLENEWTNTTDKELVHSIKLSGNALKKWNLKTVEHVTVTVNIEADVRGNVEIDLVSPLGIVSNLGVVRPHDSSPEGFQNWTFMSVAHWGEKGIGDWKLKVRSTSDGNKVKLNSWRLKIFGDSIDPKKTVPFQYGNDKENDHDENMQSAEESSSPTSFITSSNIASSTMSPSLDLTQTPTTGNAEISEDHNTPNKITNPDKFSYYVISLFGLGVLFLILYYVFFMKSRRRWIRRRGGSSLEFDIIDTESDYDSTLDNLSMSYAENTLDNPNIDDFGFDLSDEEHLRISESERRSRETPNSIEEETAQSIDMSKETPSSGKEVPVN